jgi:hypothetical protein
MFSFSPPVSYSIGAELTNVNQRALIFILAILVATRCAVKVHRL